MFPGYPPEEALEAWLDANLDEWTKKWLSEDPHRAIAVYEWEVYGEVYIITRGQYIKVWEGTVSVFTFMPDPDEARAAAEVELLEMGDYVRVGPAALVTVHVVNPYAELHESQQRLP
ncbi:MAG: hypothetical protein QXJ59_07715 [Thermofilaceae archaeon]